MTYDLFGLIATCFLMIFAVLYRFFRPRPFFVVPDTHYHTGKKQAYTAILVSFVFFACLLPANIGRVKEKHIIREKRINVQIIFDVSLSMAGTDIKPSRFHAMKDAITYLLQKLTDYEISLIAFSGKPFMYIPFTTETDAMIARFLSTQLADFTPTSDFVGTAIGDALLVGIKNLEDVAPAKHDTKGVIILITDGDSNLGTDPLIASRTAQNLEIPIFTLGIGENDLKIGEGHFGEDVMAYINIPLLEEISKSTGGKFYHVKTPKDFFSIFDTIGKNVTAQEIKKIVYEYTYINMYLLGLIATLGSILLRMRIKKS